MDRVSAKTRDRNIRSIKAFSLATYVLCSPQTLQSLQVFPAEPRSHCQSWGMKRAAQPEMESISLYSLLQSLTQTPQGRAKLRAILRNPFSNIRIIESRQQAISLLLDHQNTGILQALVRNLRKIRNAKIYVDLLRKGVDRSSGGETFAGSVWANVRSFVIHALKLRDQINALTNDPTDFMHNVCDMQFCNTTFKLLPSSY